ncbi:efflux transporter outer membrane subunit [Pectobacterium actinidiae]|uniref:efflux transporter outer membrane subunit n=1 Tax=Pectobacterium actinidiae TaxID=1507808 RepID=UPI00382B9678
MTHRVFDSLRRSRIAAGVVTLLLAGCSSMAPNTDVPQLPLAQSWPGEAAAQGGAAAHTLYWRDYFAEPHLAALIEIALTNSSDLRLALLRVEEARALYGIQRAEQYPVLGVGAQGARARTPGDLSYTGQPVVSSEYTAYAGLNSWEIDLWGRVRSLKDAALQEYLATHEAQRAARIALIAEVASTYVTLRALDERAAVARETIASREESLRIFSRRNEVGSASRLELTQVQTLLQQARSLGAQLEQQRAAQAHALVLLVGAPLDLPQMSRTALRGDATLGELAAGLPSDLLTVRPDIAAAERRLRAASANIGAARAAFFPRIALTGNFGTASAELDGLFGTGSRAWSFAPTISLPIFDGGSRRASLDLAEVRRDIAVASYEKTIQTAFREVADALSGRQWLGRQVQIQREALEAQTERARLAKLRYDSGAAAYLEVLDAQRELLEAQQQLIQTRGALLTNQVVLYAALGGGALDSTPTPTIP